MKLPPVVRCSRCRQVLLEAKPTRRKNVVCARCLGIGDAGCCWICCELLTAPQRRGYCAKCAPLQPGGAR
jgi:hypothetical protein